MKLRTLKAKSVRGIPQSWPDLSIGEKGLVIYGTNGVGKSSIVDALEYALTRKSSLYSENRQGVSWEAAAPHVRDGAPTIVIDVNISGTQKSLTSSTPIDKADAAIAEWINLAIKSSFVLRRHMLLNFISAVPRNRYDLLEPFFNIGEFVSIENTLRSLVDELETRKATASTGERTQGQRLRQIFGLQVTDSVSKERFLSKLNETLTLLSLAHCATIEDVAARKKQIDHDLGGKDKAERLSVLGGLQQHIRRTGVATNLTELLKLLIVSLRELETEISRRTQDVLVDLLVVGRQVIAKGMLDQCPLCEQEIDRETLLQKIDERIKSDEKILQLRQLITVRQKALLDTLSPLFADVKAVCDLLQSIMSEEAPDAYKELLSVLSDLSATIKETAPSSADLQILANRIEGTIQNHDLLIERVSSAIEAEGGGTRRNILVTAASQAEGIIADYPKLEAAKAQYRVASDQQSVASKVHGHAVEARKQAVQATLNDVTNAANKLYEAIHPGEGIATSKLEVRQVGQGSVSITTGFNGVQEHPLLHLSESHLDTLGLCYFLALRKQEGDKEKRFKVLILDDVMHSVDAEHRGRIAKILKAEFSDHQLIVTTHDRLFYDTLRRELGSSGYHYISISDWDLSRGPILSDPSTDLDIIVNVAGHTSRRAEDLSSTGGRFFEWLLKRLTERLHIAIPARFERKHDISSMWPALCKKIKKQQGFSTVNAELVSDLESSTWVRNECGAHDNASESPVTESEVRTFTRSLAGLYAATTCSKCNTQIAKHSNGDWVCEVGCLRYSEK